SGMTDDIDLSQDVFIFDPAKQEWTKGPDFPGDPFHGFGLAAWNESGVLYAGGMEGVVYRLSEDFASWQPVTELTTPRFFHQFAPNGRGGLLAIAGASMDIGHVAAIEDVAL
ncbi:MAG: hypothetical protein AAF596_09950, partial [Planctomycetota bacterium]